MHLHRATLAGFILFIRNVMGISVEVLPDDAPVICVAFEVALAIVFRALKIEPLIYELAVYNLAGSNLISYAQDAPGAPVYKDGMKFFAALRKEWNTNGFVSGVISETHDESTGTSLVVQQAAQNFTLANLQQLKDPYGRAYLAFAQSYGPSIWGLT